MNPIFFHLDISIMNESEVWLKNEATGKTCRKNSTDLLILLGS